VPVAVVQTNVGLDRRRSSDDTPAGMKRLVLAFTLSLVLGALWSTSAGAAPRPLDSYCSPTGDYCIGVFGPKSSPEFRLQTFSFSGKYKLCVQQQGYPRQCGYWKIEYGPHGTRKSYVKLKEHFFLFGAGSFTVSAFYSDSQLGRGLHFSRG
jgi:hypothetical protein